MAMAQQALGMVETRGLTAAISARRETPTANCSLKGGR